MGKAWESILLLTLLLWTFNGTTGNTGCVPGSSSCPPRPQIILSPAPTVQANWTTPLRISCVAYLGREATYQPTSFSWYNGLNEQIINGPQVTINTTTNVIEGHVFIESVLSACQVYSDLIGQSSCVVTNVGGEDSAGWNTVYTVPPPVVITSKPANQVVDYNDNLELSCIVLVNEEEANDTQLTWWGEFGLLPDTEATIVYTNRIRVGSTLFIESTLVVCGVEFEHFGRLSCIAENSLGRDVVNWNIDPPSEHRAPMVLVGPANQTVDCRGSVTLACVVNAFPTADVWWTLNGTYVDNDLVGDVVMNSNDMNIFGSNFTEVFLDVCNFNDDNVGYYQCSASNMFGNYTGVPVWVDIDLQTSPPVFPPETITTDRRSDSEAVVIFEPQSIGMFEISYYIANDTTTAYLTEKVGSRQTTFLDPQVTLSNLNPCNRYWVAITASDCGRSGISAPTLIGLFDDNISPYDITFTLGDKDGPCDEWVSTSPRAKAMDLESGLLAPVSDCNLNMPCFDSSRWECTEEDSAKVTFKTQLVGVDSGTADEIKTCINEWITAGLETGRTLAVAGSNITVINFMGTTPITSAPPTWVWIIVAVGGVAIVVCLIAVVLLVALSVKRKRSGSGFSKKERLGGSNEEECDDDEDHTHGDTFAVVENPLYAENEADIEAVLKEDLEGSDDEDPDSDDVKKTDI